MYRVFIKYSYYLSRFGLSRVGTNLQFWPDTTTQYPHDHAVRTQWGAYYTSITSRLLYVYLQCKCTYILVLVTCMHIIIALFDPLLRGVKRKGAPAAHAPASSRLHSYFHPRQGPTQPPGGQAARAQAGELQTLQDECVSEIIGGFRFCDR